MQVATRFSLPEVQPLSTSRAVTPTSGPAALQNSRSSTPQTFQDPSVMSIWQPETLPVALPCLLTTIYEGKPVMGNAVVDGEMPLELPLPLELVPLEEAVKAAPFIFQKGGYFIFSDDYVHKYPQSKVANMVRQFSQLLALKAQMGTVAEVSEEEEIDFLASAHRRSTVTATAAPLPASAAPGPKNKVDQVRDCIEEVERVNRPLFRRQDPTLMYGQAKYVKRNFHAILDDEYPIEYFI